jgi:molybdate transport system substrate-binding protein
LRRNVCSSRVRTFSIRNSFSYFLILLFFSTGLTSCSRKASEVTKERTDEINVAAAANLSDAFTELGKEFTTRTGIRVVFSFGATADLAHQIENNAPFDVFASADVENVDRLESKGLLTSNTRKLYARGRLVMWTPPGARFTLTSLEDLKRPEVQRIGIAKPDVAPYGRATVEALRAQSLWPQLESKVVYGQNVLQVRQYASTGNVDVAFLPLALVKAGDGQVIEVEERLHQPINQAIAVVKESHKQEAARSFVDFVTSPDGLALLERAGYRKP